jgi:hypothetical protein
MPRRKNHWPRHQRVKINLSIHPDVQEWAKKLAARRTAGQLFEDLIEAEWLRQQSLSESPELPPGHPQTPLQHQVYPTEAEILANLRYRQPVQQQQ